MVLALFRFVISLPYRISFISTAFQRRGTDLSLAIEEPQAETDIDVEREINSVLRTVSKCARKKCMELFCCMVTKNNIF